MSAQKSEGKFEGSTVNQTEPCETNRGEFISANTEMEREFQRSKKLTNSNGRKMRKRRVKATSIFHF